MAQLPLLRFKLGSNICIRVWLRTSELLQFRLNTRMVLVVVSIIAANCKSTYSFGISVAFTLQSGNTLYFGEYELAFMDYMCKSSIKCTHDDGTHGVYCLMKGARGTSLETIIKLYCGYCSNHFTQ